MPRFLPALRGGGRAIERAVQHADLVRDSEAKVVLADYYAALVNAGVNVTHGRARPWDVERAVAEGYERVVWSFAAVEAIAGSQARLRITAMDGDQEVDDDPVANLLNKGKANPMETGHQLRKRLGAQVLLSKAGAFVEKSLARSGRPYRYDILPPTRTRIVPGTGNDLIDYYELRDLGGRVIRRIDPHKVLWFRNPHPIDPYSGITPLEAAGLSIELDYFARLYNVSFMRNDGRPGGVLGVDGEMDEAEMDRVEGKFGKGPVEAGKLAVINGALTYVDTAAKPRDMQYGQTSKNAKTEILVAFGVGETLLGNAADRTFANAKEEGQSFWTVRPMPEHQEIILNGFAEDFLREGYEPGFDVSKVRALQMLAAEELAAAQLEVDKGLRSIISYARKAGYEDEMEDTPQTRALWIPTGRTPIPATEADAVALGVAPPVDPNAAGVEGSGVNAIEGAGGPGDTTAADQPALDAGASAAQAAVAAASAPAPVAGGRSAAAALDGAGTMAALPPAPPGTKALPKTQTCKYCEKQATMRLLWAEGMAYIPTCDDDEPKARKQIEVTNHDEVVSVKPIPAPEGKSRVHLAVVRSGREGHQTKAVRRLADDADEEPARESPSSEALQRSTEAALAAALDAARERLIERAIARVKSPKSRKGTRHFEKAYDVDTRVDTKALDASKIVDEDRFAAEAQAAAMPILTATADESVQDWAQDLGYTQEIEQYEEPPGIGTAGAVVVGVAATVALMAALDDSDDGDAFRLPRWLIRSVARVAIAPVLDLIGLSAQHLASGLADLINERDQAGDSLDAIVAAIREYGEKWQSWGEQVAVVGSTGTVEGSREAAADDIVERGIIVDQDISRMWLSRRDDRVRQTHKDADGQRQQMGQPFLVGEALLRFPGDPLGPPGEVRNCRCRLLWRSKSTGRFVAPREEVTA